jgi:hypothetical protein
LTFRQIARPSYTDSLTCLELNTVYQHPNIFRKVAQYFFLHICNSVLNFSVTKLHALNALVKYRRSSVRSKCFVGASVWNRIYRSVSLYVGTYIHTYTMCACVRFIPLQEHTPNVNMWTAHRDRVMAETERDLHPVAGNIFREICNSLISFPIYRLRYFCHILFSQNSLLVRNVYKNDIGRKHGKC